MSKSRHSLANWVNSRHWRVSLIHPPTQRRPDKWVHLLIANYRWPASSNLLADTNRSKITWKSNSKYCKTRTSKSVPRLCFNLLKRAFLIWIQYRITSRKWQRCDLRSVFPGGCLASATDQIWSATMTKSIQDNSKEITKSRTSSRSWRPFLHLRFDKSPFWWAWFLSTSSRSSKRNRTVNSSENTAHPKSRSP